MPNFCALPESSYFEFRELVPEEGLLLLFGNIPFFSEKIVLVVLLFLKKYSCEFSSKLCRSSNVRFASNNVSRRFSNVDLKFSLKFSFRSSCSSALASISNLTAIFSIRAWASLAVFRFSFEGVFCVKTLFVSKYPWMCATFIIFRYLVHWG